MRCEQRHDPERATGTSAATAIRCAQCGTPITSAERATSRGGATEHTTTNSFGVLFTIRLYDRAENLLLHGAPSSDFTWFAGYAWQIASCAACKAHLGWAFTGEAPFYALIIGRIVEG